MIKFENDRLQVHFERFDLQAYEIFLKTKKLPETEISFDEQRETYTLSAPARFASMLGIQAPKHESPDLPLSEFLFDYQRFIVSQALAAKRYAVWADCGLGKGPMILEFARQVVHRTGGRFLIIAPIEVCNQFHEEGWKFYKRSLPLCHLNSRDDLIAWCKGELESPCLVAPPPANITEQVIDAALHHVENQQVLRRLLAGQTWGEAFGSGGSYGGKLPAWTGSSKGILCHSADPDVESDALIRPIEIMERAGQYTPSRIAITNPQKFIPGIINELRMLAGVALDESSLLKTGGGVIKWNLIKSCRGIEYKLSCTATPAPNDTMEYASQAAFLEKLRTEGEILWTYFQRDKRGNWRVKPHAQEAFYKFMSDWSIYLRNPGRYGWTDNMKDVPAPEVHEHKLTATPEQLEAARKFLTKGTGELLADVNKLGITDRNKLNQLAKGFMYSDDGTISVPSIKPEFVAWLIEKEVSEGRQTLAWTVFDEESKLIKERLADDYARVAVLSGETKPAERVEILNRFRNGEIDVLISKASLLGYGMNFQCCKSMIFSGWNDSFEQWYQAIRRAYRYGQTEALQVHVPYIPELEGIIYQNILRKKDQFERDTAIQEENYILALGGRR